MVENYQYSPIYLQRAPVQSLTLNITVSTLKFYLIDAVHSLNIDLIFNKPIKNSAEIHILMSDDNFKFTGICKSSTKITEPLIFALPDKEYSCSVNLLKNTIIFKLNKGIIKNFKLRIEVKIKNPKKVSLTKGKIIVYSMIRDGKNIIESGKKSILELFKIKLKVKLVFGWKELLGTEKTIPFPIKIIRGPKDPNEHSYIPYNTFIYLITANQSFPSGISFRLVINHDVASEILPHSIGHNFKSFGNKRIHCNNIGEKLMACDNLGSLEINKEYYLAFKVFFNGTEKEEPIHFNQSFGIKFLSCINNKCDSEISIESFPENIKSIEAKNSPANLIPDFSFEKMFISSQKKDSSFESPTGNTQKKSTLSNLGLSAEVKHLPNPIDQRLMINWRLKRKDLTFWNEINSKIPSGAGFKILLSPNIFQVINLFIKSFFFFLKNYLWLNNFLCFLLFLTLC